MTGTEHIKEAQKANHQEICDSEEAHAQSKALVGGIAFVLVGLVALFSGNFKETKPSKPSVGVHQTPDTAGKNKSPVRNAAAAVYSNSK